MGSERFGIDQILEERGEYGPGLGVGRFEGGGDVAGLGEEDGE